MLGRKFFHGLKLLAGFIKLSLPQKKGNKRVMRWQIVRLDFQRLAVGFRRALGIALGIQNIALELPCIVKLG